MLPVKEQNQTTVKKHQNWCLHQYSLIQGHTSKIPRGGGGREESPQNCAEGQEACLKTDKCKQAGGHQATVTEQNQKSRTVACKHASPAVYTYV